MKCPKETLDKFWAVRGSQTSEQGCVNFAYQALAFSDPTGVYHFGLDGLERRHLDDWESVEEWITELSLGLCVEDVFIGVTENNMGDGTKPRDLVADEAGLKAKVIEAIRLRHNSKEGFDYSQYYEDIWCTEITDGSRSLFILFFYLDGWTLGHSDSVDVIGSLSELTEDDGFYIL
ncbi:hypothetical protein OAM46_05955 [Gammaproteobacteria bacterium]|nr:hypothetical protein [Porticoccaceae bacterium]MDC0406560.1 hypothetical protein [Gammaproteobacteria bacterium]MDC1477247.1 hypothetical protein [Porticoccaceae bacterium]